MNGATVWTEYGHAVKAYRVPVYIIAEDDGRYSALAASLPGVASRGDTVPESLANVREALTGALECYHDRGETIPWRPVPERIEATKRLYWVCVRIYEKGKR